MARNLLCGSISEVQHPHGGHSDDRPRHRTSKTPGNPRVITSSGPCEPYNPSGRSCCRAETYDSYNPQKTPSRARLDHLAAPPLRCTGVKEPADAATMSLPRAVSAGRWREPVQESHATVTITLNGECRDLPAGLTVAQLLERLELPPERVAVERNRELVPRQRHAATILQDGDELELVTLVGGGAPGVAEPDDGPLVIGKHHLHSRLFVGTGKYRSLELMRDCLDASGAEVVTVAVRRERLFDKEGRNILDFLDPKRYTILPNTAGCFNAEDAVRDRPPGPRTALEGLGNPGRGLGQARSAGRPADAAARPGRHARGAPRSWSRKASTSCATPATTR